MKNRVRTAGECSLLSLLLAAFFTSVFFCITVYAGNINGNEQSIVSVIHGQFEQDGIVYKVRQEYINSAVSYLQQDDVDLTAEQAQSVISEIYSNVQTGVESGYLEAVGQTALPDLPPAESQTGEVIDENEKPEDGGLVESPPAEGDGSGTDIQEETIPEEIIPEIPPVISILELVDKAPPQSYDYLSRDTDALMGRIELPYQAILFAIALLAVIVVIIVVVSFWKKLLIHHRYRKLRKYLKYILTMETAVLSAICLIIGGIWIGAFQDSAVLNKLADTGYYRAIFEDLKRDTSISFALLGIPDEVMEESITYERVVMAARQQVESDLSQGAYQADTTMLTDKLESDIRGYLGGKSVTMTDQAELGLRELMNRLNEKYSSLLQWPFASWWVQMKLQFYSFVKIAFPVTLFLIIISQMLIIFLNHYRHRGVLLCGRGVLLGGLLTVVVFGIGITWDKISMPEILPEYMAIFFGLYSGGIWRSGIIMGGIGILLGLIYLVAVRTWKAGNR